MDAVNGRAITGWGDPTWWVSPDGRLGFSLVLFHGIPPQVRRGVTLFADAPNYGALKAALKTAVEAVEREEKKIQKPNVPL